jgi:hypothetical protein
MHDEHVKQSFSLFWAHEVTWLSYEAIHHSKALPCRYVVIWNQTMPELTVLNVKTDVD